MGAIAAPRKRAVAFFECLYVSAHRKRLILRETKGVRSKSSARASSVCCPAKTTVANVISMDERASRDQGRNISVRDRRYCIRYPFAADAEMLDLESGSRTEGVTSDISMGGAFVCTSKPLASNARLRITLKWRSEKVEALAVVRIVKPRIGMGMEFMDVESPHHETLRRWVDQLRRSR